MEARYPLLRAMTNQNLMVPLMAASAIELVAWSLAWMLDFQLASLAGAIAVSLGVAVGIVWMLRDRIKPRA